MSALLALLAGPAYGWNHALHQRITGVAVESLPNADQDFLVPETAALAEIYCSFPDMNWGCYGQWGGGEGNPAMPRFPDVRREWDISRYCMWDPVLQEGRHIPHRPPEAYELIPSLIEKAVGAFRDGQLEDGTRYLGAMLHYVEDCGSMGHMQPFHRTLDPDPQKVELGGYTPTAVGTTLETAGTGAVERVRQLVGYTDAQLLPLLQGCGMSLEDAHRQCREATVPPEVAAVVKRIRNEQGDEYRVVATRCATETARACADVIHTVLSLAPKGRPSGFKFPANVNLVANPSFEDDEGAGLPEGWCVGWFDKADRAGRAEWYRAGTHWGRQTYSGSRSLLLLWAPEAGLEWRQTWPKAIRVRAGEQYRGTVWAKARNAGDGAHFGLQFSDGAYKVVAVETCPVVAEDAGWHQLSVEAVVPAEARWLRVVLHSRGKDGAVWFDDVEVVRFEPQASGSGQ
ncbi:MAG: hypothetical protein GY851_32550 [bacterium]|nr:hypothetical protein [bacterium]